MTSLFRVADPWPGASESTRRCLSHLNLNRYSIKRLVAAVKALGLECKTPHWLEHAWAHIGIPKFKVAISSKQSTTSDFAQRLAVAWGGYGWTHLTVDARNIDHMTQERVTGHLREALVELGKMKK